MATRLDRLLVERGLFSSRERARRAIMAGEVLVDGQRVDKAGTAIDEGARLELLGPKEPFVSRGGRKLAFALDHFGLDPSEASPQTGWRRSELEPSPRWIDAQELDSGSQVSGVKATRGAVCLDVGASTGGFTDCLLQRGAERVYAIDVGYGQLDLKLREDPRVVVMERVNVRYLATDALPERCDLAVVDVSFISLLKVVPALLPHLAPDARLLALIKPQFEAGRELVGKGGIVRDEAVRRRVIGERVTDLEALGLASLGVVDSEVRGARGNREAFALFAAP